MKIPSKILHIDDDAVMRMMVKKSLERCQKGFEIVTCVTGTQFIDTLSVFKPDILLMDVVMPLMSGPDLLTKIRQNGNKTPAIFMTGQEALDLENRELLEPILGIIHKPFTPTTLGEDIIRMWEAQNA